MKHKQNSNYAQCNKRQTALIVLLAAALCAVFAWLFCLFFLQIYTAKTAFTVVNLQGAAPNSKFYNIINPNVLLNETVGNLSKNYDMFNENVSVYAKNNIIYLNYTNQNKQELEEKVQAWISAYVAAYEMAYQSNLRLIKEIKTIRDKEIENAIIAFISEYQSNLKQLDQAHQLSSLGSQLNQAMINKIIAKNHLDIIDQAKEQGFEPLSVPFIASSPRVKQLVEDNARLDRDIAYMRTQLGSKSPHIKAMIAESAILESQLKEEIKFVIDRFYINANSENELEKKLRNQVDELQTRLYKQPDQSLAHFEQKLADVLNHYDDKYEKISQYPVSLKVKTIEPLKIQAEFKKWLYLIIISIAFFMGLLCFWLVILVFEKRSMRHSKSMIKDQDFEEIKKSLPLKAEFQTKTIEQLTVMVSLLKHGVVALVGETAPKMSARLALNVVEREKRVVLIDVSGDQIEKLIGPHRGLSDVLTGDALLEDVIYKDHDTGIDILAQGLASPMRAQDFSGDVSQIFTALKQDYEVIVITMTQKPIFAINEIIQNLDFFVFSSLKKSEQQLWLDEMTPIVTPHIYELI